MRSTVRELGAHSKMLWNVQRATPEILGEHSKAMEDGPSVVEDNLLIIREIGYKIGEAFRKSEFDDFGRLMHEHWLAKKHLSGKVTIPTVERLYDYVRDEYGVLGGKVAGAGGGGFLMLYCPKDGKRLTKFMESQGMARLEYASEFEGSRVVTNLLSSRSIHYHLDAPAPTLA